MRPLVLSIEDDPFFQKALESVISKLGLDIKTTDNVKDFLELSASLKPAIYLVDLQLADSHGFSLIPELRKNNKDSVILILSGDTSPESVARALERGANDYILKPIDRTLLASKLSQYVITGELKEHTSEVLKLEDKEIQVKLDFTMKIVSLDEMGVHVQSRHLIPKKSVLRLKCDFFKQLGTSVDEVLVTVLSSYMDFESGEYRMYAEFDDSKPEFLESLRRWMLNQSAKAER